MFDYEKVVRVVTSGGLGSRLSFTKVINEHLLPIYNKLMTYYLVAEGDYRKAMRS